jgi:protein-S-isoprenylcysteine O-methyltransferase Ste14
MSTLSTRALSRPTTAAEGLARIATLVYGILAYAAFFGAFCYAIGFVGNWLVPKSIDSGTPGAAIPSLLINGSILAAFVLQHTIMARPGFKRVWTRMIPRAAERSTYVLLASAIFVLLFWQWRPLPGIVWQTTSPAAVYALSAFCLLGFGIALAASTMVSHFDLFGLRQSWLRFRGRAYSPVGFRLVGLYKLVRHPLMLGFLIAFWSTPVMTAGHLFFSIMTTAYILMGIWFEERDLVREHRESYLEYRRTTPALIPLSWRA